MTDIAAAHSFHGEGLKASLEGDFKNAEVLFRSARQTFEASGDALNYGRVERDMARVYAGLGRDALSCGDAGEALSVANMRDYAAVAAVRIHRYVYSAASDELLLAGSELAASLHVRARVILAQNMEHSSGNPTRTRHDVDSMSHDWSEAFRLISENGGNIDYLEQIVAHGSLTLAAFGERHMMEQVEQMLEDFINRDASSPDRTRAIKLARQITVARRFHLPVPGFLKTQVANKVGGPYRVF